MSTSTLISDYIQSGTHASRPTSPNVNGSASAIYVETDTGNTFAWNGTSWVQLNSASSGPTIVQSGASANGTSAALSVTLGAAPTQGNFLIAFVDSQGSPTPASGWTTTGAAQSGGVDFSFTAWKLCGASESTTQTPASINSVGGVMMYEISNGVPFFATNNDASGASGSFNVLSKHAGSGILLGALCNNSSSGLPTAITGMTADQTATGGSVRSIAGFHASSPTPSANEVSVAYTYAGSPDVKGSGVMVY